ncbi:ATP-NAD kinase [seawater metagenome]|uniref:ATP-NAD kinase n=1 Tax=seawater metagenome TaxID=1561972 RepID=A0A5E8CK59_9ZZZZ
MKEILIIRKWNNTKVKSNTKILISWLNKFYPDKNIYVEDKEYCNFKELNINKYENNNIDLIISIGGDGTILYCNKLFSTQNRMPPIISFFLGTLGFITSHKFLDYPIILKKVFDQEFELIPRSRINCLLPNNNNYNALNEIVIHRGSSSHVLKLHITIDNFPVNKLIADGLIINTSTGSTAYNLSAGGSLIHPSVEAIMLNPICPFSLSFRPIVINYNSIVEIELLTDEASVEADGNLITKLNKNQSITIKKGSTNLYLLSTKNSKIEWFQNIIKKLNWAS